MRRDKGKPMADSMKVFRYASYGLGAITLIAGYFFFGFLDTYLFSETVEGEVIEHERDTCTSSSDSSSSRSRSSRTYTCYAEVIKYQYQGVEYIYTSSVKKSDPTAVGEITKVYVDPENPGAPKEVGFWLLFTGIWFFVSGFLAIAFYFANKKFRESSAQFGTEFDSQNASMSARISESFNADTMELKNRLLASMSDEEKNEIRRLVREKDTIAAIKYTRATLGCGLRVGKEIVEELKY